MVAHDLYKARTIRHEASVGFSFLTEDEVAENCSLECFHHFSQSINKHIITMRFRVNLILKASNEEMFGYLAEQDFSFEVENIEKDIFDIEEMLERFYANISIHIQGDAPTHLTYKPNIRKLSAETVSLLEDAGYYHDGSEEDAGK